MTMLETETVLLLGGLAGGTIGAITGLGGGVVIVPLLTLALGFSVPQAVGVSLIAVIATSTGAAPRFLGTGMTNLRTGLFLQIAASSGALIGALSAHWFPTRVVFTLFGAVLGYTAFSAFAEHRDRMLTVEESSALAERLRLPDVYREHSQWLGYGVSGVKRGFALMALAGFLSALLGIGSGALKVLALDKVMRLPFRVSTATSNFMIGVTAATSAGFFLFHGDIPPLVAGPVVLGILAGSSLGARLVTHLPVKMLRRIFAVLLLVIGVQMIVKGVWG